MDVSRELLNTLMGRDRNKPKDKMNARDHYSNRDVCKPFLVCFCFNTLFPNTIYDEGPCAKRHDTYLKAMFDNDLQRQQFQKQYIRQCIHWIDKRLVDVQQKIKKNQAVIDNKSSYTTDRPKQVLDRLIAIDQDIQKMMHQAQIFGENGQIDDSSRCLEEVQRLRQRRRQIQLMGDNMMTTQKQQKICEICGAIQTINDTQKRIQTHLEGKIHQGFLKLRHQVETLRIRLQILNGMDGSKKNKDKQQLSAEKQKHYQKDINQSRSKSQSQSKKKKKQKQKQKDKEKDKEREKDRQRDREKDKDRHRERERQQYRQRDHRDRDRSDRDRDRERQKKDHHKKKHKKQRSRSREKHQKSSYYS